MALPRGCAHRSPALNQTIYEASYLLIYQNKRNSQPKVGQIQTVASILIGSTKEPRLKEGQLGLFLVTWAIVSPPRVWC